MRTINHRRHHDTLLPVSSGDNLTEDADTPTKGPKLILSRFLNLKQLSFILLFIIFYFCCMHQNIRSSIISFGSKTSDTGMNDIKNLNNNVFGNLDSLKKTQKDGIKGHLKLDLNDPTQTTDIKVQLMKNNKKYNNGNTNINSNSDTKTTKEINSNANSNTNSQTIPKLDYSKAFDKETIPNTHINTNNEKLLSSLKSSIEAQEKEIRLMKRAGIVLETDANAKTKTQQLSEDAASYVASKYGVGPFYVQIDLIFPESMKEIMTKHSMDEHDRTGSIIMEVAPTDLTPYIAYTWLEVVERFTSGAFHRNAGHVLQALLRGNRLGLAFQEYHASYPHKRYTMGYAGRPGGPAFYVSTEDNTRNHGPGSQGSATEADGCIGRVVKGLAVIKAMQHQPGKGKNGFVAPNSNWIKIIAMKLINKSDIDSNTFDIQW